ncbi:MAG: ImmA/IrrE family metallo-endopeptidase [Bacteroidales bacterium]|nr:ImmA/IrrE family metallo-endopeptidase [Bacteroidales bacterium]
MISLLTAIILVLIHLIYYFILQVLSDIMRTMSIKNTPNKIISQLRTEYHINIKTFQKNGTHYGFAWFKTIYLNENLFMSEKKLKYVFFHELYHVRHKHKRNTLFLRALFSFTPLILAINWMVFIPVYFSFAYFLYMVNERYENEANEFATKTISK